MSRLLLVCVCMWGGALLKPGVQEPEVAQGSLEEKSVTFYSPGRLFHEQEETKHL